MCGELLKEFWTGYVSRKNDYINHAQIHNQSGSRHNNTKKTLRYSDWLGLCFGVVLVLLVIRRLCVSNGSLLRVSNIYGC
jgi:hypothetical protein